MLCPAVQVGLLVPMCRKKTGRDRTQQIHREIHRTGEVQVGRSGQPWAPGPQTLVRQTMGAGRLWAGEGRTRSRAPGRGRSVIYSGSFQSFLTKRVAGKEDRRKPVRRP